MGIKCDCLISRDDSARSGGCAGGRSFQSDYDTKHVRAKYAFKNNEKPKSTNYDNPSPLTAPSTTTTSTSTEESTTATPKPSGILGDSFFCTTSLGLVPIAVPPDGVCDYVFFDSLYTGNRFKLIDKAAEDELLMYLTAAKDSDKTEHGVGINVQSVQEARGHLQKQPDDCKNFLEILLSHHILGFGVLSINKYQFSDTALEGTVSLLKELKAFVEKELGRDDTFSLVGIYISGTDTKDTLTKTFSALGAPDVVIGLGHLDYITANSTDCEMLPPSTYNNNQKSQQLRAKYGSLYELPAKVADMAKVMQGIRGPVWAVASTLAARVYEPSEPTTKHELYDRCNRKDAIDQYDTPIKGCDGVNFPAVKSGLPYPFEPLTGFEGARIYNGITFKYYAFDNADSLVRKLQGNVGKLGSRASVLYACIALQRHDPRRWYSPVGGTAIHERSRMVSCSSSARKSQLLDAVESQKRPRLPVLG
ncbi:hypothetical protein MTO96_038851 [Rhipicephalus appendiculatus]